MTREQRALYARRRREAKLAAENASRTTCSYRLGNHGTCGGRLEITTDGTGRMVVTCPRCARRKAGICQHCPLPVVGMVRRALYCATHRKASRKAAYQKHNRHNAESRRASARERARTHRSREAHCAYLRDWRKLNRDKVKAQRKLYALRNPEKIRAYREAYNRTHPTIRRGVQRTCLTCPTLVSGRIKKCLLCKGREAVIARDNTCIGRGKGWRRKAA